MLLIRVVNFNFFSVLMIITSKSLRMESQIKSRLKLHAYRFITLFGVFVIRARAKIARVCSLSAPFDSHFQGNYSVHLQVNAQFSSLLTI